MRIATKCLAIIAVGATALFGIMPTELGARMRCTMAPASTLAVLRVERDTTLPFAFSQVEVQSYTSISGRQDTLLARPDTPMPAARVRMLQLDSATRAALVRYGITDSQPMAFIRAAPYGADCRTRRWTDTIPFVVPGEVGFVRASLVQREYWIGATPVFVIPEAWSYPYPRRGRQWDLSPDVPLAPAEAMFGVQRSFDRPAFVNGATREDYEAAEQDAFRSDTAVRVDPANRKPLVWLAVNDRPTTAGNDARGVITGMLEFQLGATPVTTWTALERFVPPLSRSDSLMLTRLSPARPRRDLQPRFPITLHMDARGNVRAESTFARDGYRLRIAVVRVDTISARRRF